MSPLFRQEITIATTSDGLTQCMDLVDQIESRFELDFESGFRLRTIMMEAVQNAFIHGNKGVKEKQVNVSIEVATNEIFLTIEDSGDGFRLEDIPYCPETPDLFRPCGRGLFFIRKLCSRCETGGKGNIFQVWIDLDHGMCKSSNFTC